MGMVTMPMPAMKKLVTKSSKLTVKAKRAPLMSAGRARGKVIFRKACHSVAPRSMAASSRQFSLRDKRRPRMEAVVKGRAIKAWAQARLQKFSGTPAREKNESRPTPMTISGIMSGALSRAK